MEHKEAELRHINIEKTHPNGNQARNVGLAQY